MTLNVSTSGLWARNDWLSVRTSPVDWTSRRSRVKCRTVAAAEPVDRLLAVADEEALWASRGGVPAMRQETE